MLDTLAVILTLLSEVECSSVCLSRQHTSQRIACAVDV